MAEASNPVIKNHAAFIWSVADLLRGDYKQSEYGRVILPLTVLRRLDCVLEPTKRQVLEQAAKYGDRPELLEAAADEQFYNTSKYDFAKLLAAPDDLADNLKHYIASFSPAARDVIDKFGFDTQIPRLDRSNLLYLVVSKFAEIDLHPDAVSNLEMGYLYEELIRRFSELSNETAGEHFTPREVIRLMVNLLLIEDVELLTGPGISKTIYDGACGTGGMLSIAEEQLRELNPSARLEMYGQELNAETYAICRSSMMLKGQDATNIALGNSLSEDGHPALKADYSIQNPPFGVGWKTIADTVNDEAKSKGFTGRFGIGTPRINDGSFLFLQNAISKMKPVDQGGSRIAIIFNGAPLFNGAAGSGESEIRRWIFENDWLEAVVALPDQLFYNTGVSTYFWILTNRKSAKRRGKVQLVDARDMFTKMRKSLGEKRKQISDTQIADIVRAYRNFEDGDGREYEGVVVKVLPNMAFDTANGEGSSARPDYRIAPWMFLPNVRAETHLPLAEFGSLNPERCRAQGEEPILLATDLALCQSAEDVTGKARAGTSYSVCAGGDVVGGASAWRVLPEEFGRALTNCDVIRVDDEHRHARTLLCIWLLTPECRLQLHGPRLAVNRPGFVGGS